MSFSAISRLIFSRIVAGRAPTLAPRRGARQNPARRGAAAALANLRRGGELDPRRHLERGQAALHVRLDLVPGDRVVHAVREWQRANPGQRVRVLPNHACVVSNLHDFVVSTRGEMVEGRITKRVAGIKLRKGTFDDTVEVKPGRRDSRSFNLKKPAIIGCSFSMTAAFLYQKNSDIRFQ